MGKLERLKELFAGRHFDREIILWYLRFKLSLRDLVEMMAERGLSLAHTPYVKIKGVWHYLYRAMDQAGRTIDFRFERQA